MATNSSAVIFRSLLLGICFILLSLSLNSATSKVTFETVREVPFNNKYDLSTHGMQILFAFWVDLDDTTVLTTPDALYRFSGKLDSSTILKHTDVGAAIPRIVDGQGKTLLYLDAYVPGNDGARYFVSHDSARSFLSVDDAFRFEWWNSLHEEWAEDYLVTSWLQYSDGVWYCNAGNSPMLHGSLDNGVSWDMVFNPMPSGETGNLAASGGSHIVIDRLILSGGEAPLDMAWIHRAKLDETGLGLAELPSTVTDWELLGNRDIQTFHYNRRYRTIFAGAEGAVLRSTDKGQEFEYSFKYPYSSDGSNVAIPEGSEDAYPYVTSFSTPSSHATAVVAGGYDKPASTAYLAWSPDNGETWVNLSGHVRDLGQYTAFIVEDAYERILVGVSCGERGRLTVAELSLPHPLAEAEPDATYIGRGWWRSTQFGGIFAADFPYLYSDKWRGWLYLGADPAHEPQSRPVYDPAAGWLHYDADLHPYAWHYGSGEFVRLAPARPGRVFQRFEDGKWVDIEGGDGG